MKKFGLFVFVLLLAAVPASVFGSLADAYFSYTPESGGGVVTVHSWVDQLVTAQLYRYNYQIIEPAINIQWFSVELLPDAIISNAAIFTGAPGEPIVWQENGVGTSFDATFINPIVPGQTSAVLWFDSPQLPTTENGMAAGISSGKYTAFYGDLYTPIPEPATLGLFVLGASLALRKNRV